MEMRGSSADDREEETLQPEQFLFEKSSEDPSSILGFISIE